MFCCLLTIIAVLWPSYIHIWHEFISDWSTHWPIRASFIPMLVCCSSVATIRDFQSAGYQALFNLLVNVKSVLEYLWKMVLTWCFVSKCCILPITPFTNGRKTLMFPLAQLHRLPISSQCSSVPYLTWWLAIRTKSNIQVFHFFLKKMWLTHS